MRAGEKEFVWISDAEKAPHREAETAAALMLLYQLKKNNAPLTINYIPSPVPGGGGGGISKQDLFKWQLISPLTINSHVLYNHE